MSRAEQGADEGSEFELTLVRGADKAGEDLFGIGAAARTISATDLAGNHSGAVGLFGAPVGSVNGGVGLTCPTVSQTG